MYKKILFVTGVSVLAMNFAANVEAAARAAQLRGKWAGEAAAAAAEAAAAAAAGDPVAADAARARAEAIAANAGAADVAPQHVAAAANHVKSAAVAAIYRLEGEADDAKLDAAENSDSPAAAAVRGAPRGLDVGAAAAARGRAQAKLDEAQAIRGRYLSRSPSPLPRTRIAAVEAGRHADAAANAGAAEAAAQLVHSKIAAVGSARDVDDKMSILGEAFQSFQAAKTASAAAAGNSAAAAAGARAHADIIVIVESIAAAIEGRVMAIQIKATNDRAALGVTESTGMQAEAQKLKAILDQFISQGVGGHAHPNVTVDRAMTATDNALRECELTISDATAAGRP